MPARGKCRDFVYFSFVSATVSILEQSVKTMLKVKDYTHGPPTEHFILGDPQRLHVFAPSELPALPAKNMDYLWILEDWIWKHCSRTFARQLSIFKYVQSYFSQYILWCLKADCRGVIDFVWFTCKHHTQGWRQHSWPWRCPIGQRTWGQAW